MWVGINDGMTAGTPISRNEMKSSSLGEYIRTQQKIILPPMSLPREVLAPK